MNFVKQNPSMQTRIDGFKIDNDAATRVAEVDIIAITLG